MFITVGKMSRLRERFLVCRCNAAEAAEGSALRSVVAKSRKSFTMPVPCAPLNRVTQAVEMFTKMIYQDSTANEAAAYRELRSSVAEAVLRRQPSSPCRLLLQITWLNKRRRRPVAIRGREGGERIALNGPFSRSRTVN